MLKLKMEVKEEMQKILKLAEGISLGVCGEVDLAERGYRFLYN